MLRYRCLVPMKKKLFDVYKETIRAEYYSLVREAGRFPSSACELMVAAAKITLINRRERKHEVRLRADPEVDRRSRFDRFSVVMVRRGYFPLT